VSTRSFEAAYNTISSTHPTSQGTLKPFIANLSDLNTIKLATEAFLKENYRLDVLFLNADAPTGNNDSNLAMRTNCLAPFLLTRLLYPLMHRTATHFCHINTSIRIVYVSSPLRFSAPRGGVQLVPATEEGRWEPKRLSGMEEYMHSKAGTYLLSQEFALRHKALVEVDEHGMRSRNTAGVLHVCVDPGGVKTVLPAAIRGILDKVGKGEKYGRSPTCTATCECANCWSRQARTPSSSRALRGAWMMATL
jgi:retinol dehydrogenase-12